MNRIQTYIIIPGQYYKNIYVDSITSNVALTGSQYLLTHEDKKTEINCSNLDEIYLNINFSSSNYTKLDVTANCMFINNFTGNSDVVGDWFLNGATILNPFVDFNNTKFLYRTTNFQLIENLAPHFIPDEYSNLSTKYYINNVVIGRAIQCQTYNEGREDVYYFSENMDYLSAKSSKMMKKSSFTFEKISTDVIQHLYNNLSTLRIPVWFVTVDNQIGLIKLAEQFIIDSNSFKQTTDKFGYYTLKFENMVQIN